MKQRKKLKKDTLVLHYSDYDLIIFNNKSLKIVIQEDYDELYTYLKEGTSLEKLRLIYPKHEIETLWNALIKIGALVDIWENSYINSIYEKQLYYLENITTNPIEAQRSIEDKCIAIIGVGGVGCVVLEQLIRIGIKKYILIDDDKVQTHNLNRQYMYELDNVGSQKVDVCYKKILEMNPKAQVSTFQQRIECAEDLSDIFTNQVPDLIVNAADHPYNLKQEVLKACIVFNVPFITAGVGTLTGRVGPLITETSYMKSYIEQLELVELPKNIEDLSPITGSFGPSNSIIGTLLTYDIMNYLLEQSPTCLNKILNIEFNKIPFKSTPIKINTDKSVSI